MAWSSADVTAAELAAFALDKPLMVGIHALESPQIARWDADGQLDAGSDISATGYPARWSYDRRTGMRTKPNAAATVQYLAFQLNASPEDFDCIFIQDHNFGTIGGLTVSIEIANNNTFSAGGIALTTAWSPGSSNARLANLNLNHSGSGSANAQRYSGVGFLRLVTTGGSHTPEVGELWVGRRRQLLQKGNRPYDDLGLRSSQRDFETQSGMVSSSVRYKGRRVVEADFNPNGTTEKSDITSWFRECNWGTRSFVWVENPSTAPASYNTVKLNDPEFSFPFTGPTDRQFSLRAVEQGPDFLDPELNP